MGCVAATGDLDWEQKKNYISNITFTGAPCASEEPHMPGIEGAPMGQFLSGAARRRRKGGRLVRWTVIALLALAGIAAATLFGPIIQQRMAVRAFYEQVVSTGRVKAAELESGWDRVCVATPYCGGPGDLSRDICDSFQDDGTWGVVFLKGEKVTAIHKYTAHVRYKEGQTCFRADEQPAFVRVEDKVLTMKKIE